jgi:hypothetical protein
MMIRSFRLTNVALQNLRKIRRSSDTMMTTCCHPRCAVQQTKVEVRLLHTTSKDSGDDDDDINMNNDNGNNDNDNDNDDQQQQLQALIRRLDDSTR